MDCIARVTVQPLLAYAKESNMTLQNVYDTLLPLFNGGNISNEAQIQPLYSSHDGLNQPLSDVDLKDALDEEKAKNEEARTLPKWLVQTLCENRLATPLSNCSCLGV